MRLPALLCALVVGLGMSRLACLRCVVHVCTLSEQWDAQRSEIVAATILAAHPDVPLTALLRVLCA